MKIQEVGHILRSHKRICGTSPTSPCSPSNSMDKYFRLRGEVPIDNIIKQWNVDATSRNVGDNQQHGLPRPKPGYMDFSSILIHVTITHRRLNTLLAKQDIEKLYMMFGGHKNQCLLIRTNMFPDQVQQGGVLLLLPQGEEGELQVRADLSLQVEANKLRVSQTSLCKFSKSTG
ncbi:hypothetical protein V8G54_009205 [Vigna mungo]|uniref:Uncharacterized protein n=1 Tax=Vigna mungo TaxID=3915 RepID=A0AAQ3NXK9_VIGMU